MWSPGDHALATVTIPTVNTSDITGTSFPRFMSRPSLISGRAPHTRRRTRRRLARERGYGRTVSRKHAEEHVVHRRAPAKTRYGVAYIVTRSGEVPTSPRTAAGEVLTSWP